MFTLRKAMRVPAIAILPAAITLSSSFVIADSPPAAQRMSQDTSQSVSDWAQAGILWSQAHYGKKLATTAATLQNGPAANQHLEQAARLDQLIDQLEAFGWNRTSMTKTNAKVGINNRGSGAGDRLAPVDSESADPNSADPTDVAQQLRRELGMPAERSPNQPSPTIPKSGDVAAVRQPQDRSMRVFETETPAGRDDPGIDDELNQDLESVDITHYRVDDYVDETPAERRNVADAIEDGAEAALAAGIDNAAMPIGGRISIREMQTNSTTLPYAIDSIYDSDDRDPDVDYRVENPLEAPSQQESGLAAVNQGYDGKDDIDNENELASSLVGSEQTTAPDRNAIQSADPASTRTNPTRSAAAMQDASWVDLTLANYQARWNLMTADGRTPSLDQIESQLAANQFEMRATASMVFEKADSDSLRKIAAKVGAAR